MSPSSEEQAVSSKRGKWSQAGIPHKGWRCVEIEDLGEPGPVCEMCEAQSIRYVHYMEHPDYPGTLGCGCVCAGYMEQNVAAARGREKSMRSRAGKRDRWADRRWKRSAKGNVWLKSDGYRVTIFLRGKPNEGWAAGVFPDGSNQKLFTRRSYDSEKDAKLAAFDLITDLLRKAES